MPKPTPHVHQAILRYGNELGYFPFKSHLRELNIRAADIWGEKRGGDFDAPFTDDEWQSCVRQALAERYDAKTDPAQCR